MKKVIIGLLILAAGAATIFLLQKNQKPAASIGIQQEQIIGKWKLDSLQFLKDSNDNFLVGIMAMVDPHLKKYQYEFKRNGAIALSLGDSLTKDSSSYEWNKDDKLTWKEYPGDTTGTVFTVPLLNNDSLTLLSGDSVLLLFSKLK